MIKSNIQCILISTLRGISNTLLFLLLTFSALSQSDSTYLIGLYDRALEFDESKRDSIAVYAEQIESKAKELNYSNGELLAVRLRGIHSEYYGDYQKAIDYYLRCLQISREKKLQVYEISALSDLAYVYTSLRNPAKAKEYYLLTAEMSIKRGEVSSIVSNLSNLGAIYNQLGFTDSALYYLNDAMKYAEQHKNEISLTSLRNNIGNAWFQKKQWRKSLEYFRSNYDENLLTGDRNMLWYDVLNMADVFIELKKYDSAYLFLNKSMEIARELGSPRKEADVHELFAKYYSRVNNYREAYESLQKWNSIDTSLVNAETRETILKMEQLYHAKEREQENKLLVSQVESERLRSRIITGIAIGVGSIALLSAVFLFLIRKKNRKLEEKNDLIQQQNARLAELNAEKNSLISVVSHDLSTPFTSIKMWSQLLDAGKENLNGEQHKAVERIKSSVDSGIEMIRNILDVERADINRQVIKLESFDFSKLVLDVVQDHVPSAEKKGITLHTETITGPVKILSDKLLLSRVCANLISNAIKFTPGGRNIYVECYERNDQAILIVRDEGLGISKDEMKFLFTKYSRISTAATDGEKSTGLGLAIVKRILDELNGTITCESEFGTGTTFTVRLKK